MLPTYTAAVKIHRFLVKFIIVLGLIMLGTGMVLEYPNLALALIPPRDVNFVRLLHRNTAIFFGPIFLVMLLSGSYMYFYFVLSRIKILKMSLRVKLVAKEEVARETMSFLFEKPTGVSFVAGQYLVWALVNPPETDEKGTHRPFTISAAPFEKYLSFTTRMRDSAFKRVMRNMAIGTKIEITGPEGDFILPRATSNRLIVFIAGGIGITPFRSMALAAGHDKLPHKIFLFYANRTPKDAAFLEELQGLEKKNPNFKLIATMTQPNRLSKQSKSKDTYERGYIDEKMIKKHLPDFKKALYFVAGPPEMVAGMKETLLKMKVAPNSILTDMFGGY